MEEFNAGDAVIILQGRYRNNLAIITAEMPPQHFEVSFRADGRKQIAVIEREHLARIKRNPDNPAQAQAQAEAAEMLEAAQAQAARAMSAADNALRAANEEYRRKEANAAARREFTREVRWHLKEYGEKETRALFNNTVRAWKSEEF